MFQNEDGLHTVCLEDPILLPDISLETFYCLLEFLYTNSCSLNEANVSMVKRATSKTSLNVIYKGKILVKLNYFIPMVAASVI